MLRVKINKRLPDFVLDMTFTVQNNILVLFGPSGCGKTTTLRCVAGLSRPDHGNIAMKNRLFFSSEKRVFLPPQKRKVGYMFQDYALFPHYDVRRNILYGVSKMDIAGQARYRKLLDMLKISHLSERYPAVLSGGEKQRVALARALMAEPEILLLDEPLSAVGDDIRKELQEELKKLHTFWGIPFILVTHSLSEAEYLGDEIIFMEKGQVVKQDKTAGRTAMNMPHASHAVSERDKVGFENRPVIKNS